MSRRHADPQLTLLAPTVAGRLTASDTTPVCTADQSGQGSVSGA